MLQLSYDHIAQIVTGIVGLLTAIVLGVQSWLKKSKEYQSEHSLIKLMHDELERMSKQNKVLSDEIGKLQYELIRLNGQLSTLSAENQKLQSEVSNLNSEIARLHGLMAGQKEEDNGITS